MTTGDEVLLRRYIDAVWTQHDPTAVEEFLAPTYRRHLTPMRRLDLAGQIERLETFWAAFPDAELTVEQVVAAGGFVAFRSTLRGTHLGPFLGIAPTGREVTVALLDLLRVEGGRFVEQWGGPDVFDLVHQLGAEVVAPTEEHDR